MKKRLIFYIMLVPMLMFSSCLQKGLDELPAFDNKEILTFAFEYRTIDYSSVEAGYENATGKLSVTYLDQSSTYLTYTIDSDAATVDCQIVVPLSCTSPAVQSDITLENLVGYCSVSTAACVTTPSGSPTLGAIDDWSDMSYKYIVVAADGSEKEWTVTITSFTYEE